MKRKLLLGAVVVLVLGVINLSLLSFVMWRRSVDLQRQVTLLSRELEQSRQANAGTQDELPVLQQLHAAAGQGDIRQLQALLAAHPELVNANGENKFGNTPLHFAAYNGHLECTAELIKRGANVNAKNRSGNTPLHDAITGGHEEIVRLLLNSGANSKLRNSAGKDALDFAAEKNRVAIAEIIREFVASEKG